MSGRKNTLLQPGILGPKLARNAERDREARQALEAIGWRVLAVWECETKDEATLTDRLVAYLDLRPPRLKKGRDV